MHGYPTVITPLLPKHVPLRTLRTPSKYFPGQDAADKTFLLDCTIQKISPDVDCTLRGTTLWHFALLLGANMASHGVHG